MSFIFLLFYFLASFVIFGTAGFLAMWVDRKVTARLQWRVGPPWWQNFADFVKLWGKEVLIPRNSNVPVFIIAPILAVAAATLAGMITIATLTGISAIPGDLLLLVYLLTIPSLAIIIGGSASGNVLASVGISRELKLIIGYEFPFICALIIPAVKSGLTTSLAEIVQYQYVNTLNIFSLSGVLGFIIALFSVQGKLGFVPFDLAEAEGEIGTGAMIEYSGILLGLFKFAKAVLLVVYPLLLVSLYFGGIVINSTSGIIISLLKYLLVLVLIILIKNTNPRLRIDQTIKFFWGGLSTIGIIAIAITFLGW
jgi:NADH-quinone oxidoreductase subunit H